MKELLNDGTISKRKQQHSSQTCSHDLHISQDPEATAGPFCPSQLQHSEPKELSTDAGDNTFRSQNETVPVAQPQRLCTSLDKQKKSISAIL